jgi:uncharacterized protein
MNSTSTQTNWTAIVTFYLIACAFSWPFFAWRDLYPENWAATTVPAPLRNLGVMWGPGIAALICFFIFRKTHVRTITITGTSTVRSLLFFLLPYAIWIIILLINPDEKTIAPEYFLQLIPFGFLMIIGEELGWRGFLQDALRPLKEWKRWLVLGLMWEFWHFTRGLVEGGPLQLIIRKTFMIALVLIMTYIIGKLTDKTKSLIVAVTLHSWVDIQFEYSHLNTHLAGVLSIIIWAVLLWKWDNKDNNAIAFSAKET